MLEKISQRPTASGCALQGVTTFQDTIQYESARNLRSNKSSLLVLIDMSCLVSGERPLPDAEQILSFLSSSTREIDVKGWHTEGEVLGILFSEFGSMNDSVDAATKAIVGRLYDSLSGMIGENEIRIAPYILPARIADRKAPPWPHTVIDAS